jgi:hypothetical protein
MKSRCETSINSSYPHYGGRGISVCDEWQDFNNFCQWMLDHGSAPGLQLDRIDVNGNYEPSNCRLVTPTVNHNNKRNNHRFVAWGENKTIAEWSRDSRCVVSKYIIENRINKLGWTDYEKVLTASADRTRKSQNPTHCKHGHEYNDTNTYYSKATPHLKKCRRCHADRQLKRHYATKETKEVGLYD